MQIRYRASALFSYLLFGAMSITVFVPLIIMLLNSIKSKDELTINPLGFPHHLHFNNYSLAWIHAGFLLKSVNSIIVTAGSVFLIVITGALASYAIARMKVGKWAGFVFAIFLAGLILPASAGLIPLFTQIREMGLFDTLIGLIFIYTAAGLPITIFIFTKFFKSIPYELEEAAIIDGLNYLQRFWFIMLPLMLPAAVTAIIINALGVWNDFFIALVFTSDPSHYTLPRGLIAFKSQFSTDWSQLFAASTMIALPILILYIFLQRFLIDGLTAGSVK
jgi:raffinose/stachyose/melibiose transport system permease protein